MRRWLSRTSLVLLLFLSLFCGSRALFGNPEKDVVIYTSTAKYDPLAWLRGEDRFPRGAQLYIRSNEESRLLAPGFSATADASVSFDAKRLLFAGKREKQDWQIYELTLGDKQVRQVTHCPGDCIRPLYLPEERLVYAQRVSSRYALESASLSGDNVLPLSYAPGNFLPNDVLQDGRILFSAGSPLGTNSTAELYTVYSDGSGVDSVRCDHAADSRLLGKQQRSGDIVFAHGKGLSRFTSALANESRMEVANADYSGGIDELSDGRLLVALRTNAKSHFALYEVDATAKSVAPVLADANNDLVQPTRLAARQAPLRHPSGLHDWKTANLLTLNARVSRTSTLPVAPATVRGFTIDATGHSRLLGTSPIAKDGSFFVQVRGDQPVRFELLDANGKVVAQEHGYFWSRKGEQRVCVGCHAGPEHAPDNAVPLVLQHSTVPADFTATLNTPRAGGHK